jgi:hypothetical protein
MEDIGWEGIAICHGLGPSLLALLLVSEWQDPLHGSKANEVALLT